MEPEVTADDRPAPPGTICPASSIREKEEASSAARCSQRPRKASQSALDLTRATPLFLTEAVQPNHHLQNLAHPLIQGSTFYHQLAASDEMLSPAQSKEPVNSGNTRWCDVLEEWEAHGNDLDREALTVILRSPWPWAEVALHNWETEELEMGNGEGYNPVVL